MSVTLAIIPEAAKAEVRALLDRYLSELSAFGEVNPSYPYFEAYWREPGLRWPYFLLCDDAVIGFALVRRLSETGVSMAEFYIAPSARGRGHSVAAAVRVFSAHPGRWQLTVFERNTPARRFWPKAIAAAGAHVVSRTEAHGETVFHFNVPAGLRADDL